MREWERERGEWKRAKEDWRRIYSREFADDAFLFNFKDIKNILSEISTEIIITEMFEAKSEYISVMQYAIEWVNRERERERVRTHTHTHAKNEMNWCDFDWCG